MTAQFPSSTNTFVKDHAATGKLVVDFSRNENDWALNRYAQLVDVKKVAGYYLEMTLEQAARILNTDLSDAAWPDNANAPSQFDGTESFQFKEFHTDRFLYGATIGWRTEDQASWDIVAQHLRIHAQRAMTARTLKAITLATTAGNYDSTHTSAVAAISGNSGTWAASTTARTDIKRSLNYAAELILKDTLGAISPSDLILVISPTTARKITESQEIVDYLKQSPDSWAWIKGDLANQNKNLAFGLPPTLYGFEVVIEKTVRVSTRKGATTSKDFVLPSTTPFLCARVGSLEGMYGGPSFSMLTNFVKEDMTTERKDDSDNRLTNARIIDDFGMKMTAPVSGFLFTSAV